MNYTILDWKVPACHRRHVSSNCPSIALPFDQLILYEPKFLEIGKEETFDTVLEEIDLDVRLAL
jgi:hypothetical protein